MDKFTLTIELGNDAMRSPADVAIALRDTAHVLLPLGIDGWRLMGGTFRDAYGNTVGRWEVS